MSNQTTDLTFRCNLADGRDLPCPDCGHTEYLYGLSLVKVGFGHNHTKYVCLNFDCQWTGWFVPGWDRDPDVSA